MIKLKNSQISIEFVMLIAITFTFVFVFLLLTASQLKRIQANKEFILVKDLAIALQNEILLAADVEDGYLRNFTIPSKLDAFDFNITESDKFLSIESENAVYSVRIPSFIGNLTKGNNVIKKENGVVYVNQ